MGRLPAKTGRRAARSLLLLLTSAVLLTLSAAPAGQWYLAWGGLAPWLIAVAESPSARWAATRGFAGGVFFFALNTWWLWTASIPGTVLLILYLSLYWGAAAAAIHGLGLLPTTADAGRPAPRAGWKLGRGLGPAGCTLGVAVTWVALEWLRCNLIAGFPWLPLGVTQTPVVVLCQVADFGGPSIVSFWLALVNAGVAWAWLGRGSVRTMATAALAPGLALALTAAYGGMRIYSTATEPGPTVLVLQSNFRHERGGAATTVPEQAVDFFLTQLEHLLSKEPADFALLPEAAFPPLNAEARRELARAPVGAFLEATHQRLAALAKEFGASLLVGGNAVTEWRRDGTARVGSQIRNAAYYFPAESTGGELRYDKTHLVPFSEQSPFAGGPSWLRRWALTIAAGRASQPLTPGDPQARRPFELSWQQADGSRGKLRFISPICLEAIDPRVVSQMMSAGDAERKPVGLIANLSNDGWFVAQEKHLHFQSLVLRAIEHRAPLVRSSNTGISGWIDSTGRIRETVGAGVSGAAAARIELDRRVTFYSRYGDVFAGCCVGVFVVAGAAQAAGWLARPRGAGRLAAGVLACSGGG